MITLTLAQAIRKAAQTLSEQGIDHARLDAELLLSHRLHRDRVWIITHIHDALGEKDLKAFEDLVERRAKREPLQHIRGTQEFWGLDFMVTPDVLIPRPETELVVESAIKIAQQMQSGVTFLDLCTGSGCIAICLAHDCPSARVLATDASSKALVVARENAGRNSVADRITFLHGDLFEPLESLDIHGQIDIIVTNPPYIPSGDLSMLQPEVRDFEPEMALIAGPVGTEIASTIIGQAPAFLKQGGALIMEMGMGQADALAAMVRADARYASLEILKDLAGIERVIKARKA